MIKEGDIVKIKPEFLGRYGDYNDCWARVTAVNEKIYEDDTNIHITYLDEEGESCVEEHYLLKKKVSLKEILAETIAL